MGRNLSFSLIIYASLTPPEDWMTGIRGEVVPAKQVSIMCDVWEPALPLVYFNNLVLYVRQLSYMFISFGILKLIICIVKLFY
jgi:hypothetical protein